MSIGKPAARDFLIAVPALNLVALGLGLGSLLLAGRVPQGSLCGAAFLLVLIVNPLLIAVTALKGFKGLISPPPDTTTQAACWRRAAVIYLAAASPALLGMLAGNFVLSSQYERLSAVTLACATVVYGGFAAVCLLGGWSGVAVWRALRSRDIEPVRERPRTPARAGAALGVVLCLAALGFAAFMGALLLFGGTVRHPLGWFAILGATFGPFWGAIALHAAVLIAVLLLSPRHGKAHRTAGGRAADGFAGAVGAEAVGAALGRPLAALVVGLGVMILVVQLLPLVALPVYLRQSRRAFDAMQDAAGPQLRRPGEGGLPVGFKDRPFALTGYFLGIPRQRCEIRRDVRFFDGAAGSRVEERNLELYFDAFLPLRGPADPPSLRPVLIRIHGGGWRLGDKGLGNMMQMNRHFAAQGYAVFDVQYGLKGDPDGPPVVTPRHVLGPFDLDDMMRHLGYFTRYLREHAGEYGADLEAVFVSGGSAGGQLACALGLALAGGVEPELLGSGFTVRGLVPFYPANGVPASWVGGQERWRSPEALVRADSPPCLVFQGRQDSLVSPETALRLCRAYRAAGNPSCAVLMFPFAPHAADIYFPGYYNQVFLYFMERFLYTRR